ncbi:hypothetical protein [Turneriella parva]|uniref:Uncharacterized protein n=1 Tax=Turneriella parva (strain ATCC BAA-1111 / DSM 21527 / NCTC 11395 / H) TaxID=869212 RepID=I4B1C2_TURPD|nr:hypothetical protein [Turneriella parva]AFM11079.1 hypothetical protein Turpa_0423 [Turneriella parva DSM 21527]
MPIRKLAYRLVFGLAVSTSLFAESNDAAAAAGATAENTSLPDAKPAIANRLPVANPLFLPSQNQFYVEIQGGWQRYASKVTFPAQTVSGVPLAAGSTKTTRDSVRMAATLAYALHDRFVLGLDVLYLASERVSLSNTGSLSSLRASATTSTGFYNPRFSAIGRLLGLGRNEWFLDAGGIYSPGIKSDDPNAFAKPMSEVEAKVRVGKNSGPWTAGIGVSLAYSIETMHKGITYRSTTALLTEAVVQYDMARHFIDAGIGLIQYVDRTSANDALNGKMRTIIQFGLGTRFTQNVFARVSVGWLMPISADYRESGYLFQVEDIGGPVAFLTIGARF